MRNKIESVRLSGRISTNTMTKEEVEFVKEQLENLTKTQLVRRAIKVLYKHETGQLYKDALRDIRDTVDITEEREVTNKKVYDNLNEMIDRYR